MDPSVPNDHDDNASSLTGTAIARPTSAVTAPPAMKDKETRETPHDRVLRGMTAPAPVSSGADAGATTTAHSASAASPAFPSGPEDIYDPATGGLAGTLRSPNAILTTTGAGDADLGLDRTSASPPPPFTPSAQNSQPSPGEDMWAQLSKIRILQSEIAKMHMALDKPGIVDSTVVGGAGVMGPTKSVGSGAGMASMEDVVGTGRTRSGTGGATGGGTDGTASAIPDDEFAKRKENIGAIMSKV